MFTSDKLPFIFLHVPRTGGVSMSKIIYPHFKPEERYVVYVEEEGGNSRNAVTRFKEFPQAKKDKIKLIGGHAYFGLHEYYDKYTYFTLLRNPVDRIISIYSYALSWDGHYLHDQIISNRWSLNEFVDSKISTELDNAMVRMLSGSYDIPFGKCTEELLEKAKQNLINFFPTFGITDRFVDTVAMLNTTHGIQINLFDKKRHNVSKVVLSPEQTTDDVKAFIKKTNELDFKLYEYACQIFEERINENKEAYNKEINRLKTVVSAVEKYQNSKILKYFVPLQKWYYRKFKS